VHDTGEHAGVGALEARGLDAGAFEDFPRDLEQQPLLRIGGEGLARADPEKSRLEFVGVVKKPAFPRIALSRGIRIRVVQSLDVPTPIVRKLGDGVLPQLQ
jgi:hypothetical protein